MFIPKKSRLIINADDFGLSSGINKAIIDCFLRGVITSASIVVNMDNECLQEIVKFKKNHLEFGLGIHLNLIKDQSPQGETITRIIKDNKFLTLKELIIKLGEKDENLINVILEEFNTQIETFKKVLGTPTHVDSYYHLHLHPVLIMPVINLIKEKNIYALRYPIGNLMEIVPKDFEFNILDESWIGAKIISRKIHCAEKLLGADQVGQISRDYIKWIFANIKKETVELMVHPGILTPLLEKRSELTHGRYTDYISLINTNITDLSKQYNVDLINFSEL